jgi:3-hydroxyisobutyrate dehydrogenase
MAAATGGDARAVVAVIGAGIMGSAMARNLAAAGLDTRVWDRSAAATAPLAAAGAVVAPSASEAVRDADVVITMLPTAEAVESVIFDGGVAGAFADGCVWAQMGTIGIEPTRRISDRLAAQRPGVTFVDAPVSGSKGPAEQGQLLILASGPATAADRLAPVFSILGRKTVWLGQAGQGSVVKLVVNAYMSILIEGVAETMELADRFGIGHQELADVIAGGPLDAPIADAKLHKMDRGDYAAEFPLEWALKDVDLAIGAAGGQAPPLLAALSAQWHAAVAAGHGRQDISAARLALAGDTGESPRLCEVRSPGLTSLWVHGRGAGPGVRGGGPGRQPADEPAIPAGPA